MTNFNKVRKEALKMALRGKVCWNFELCHHHTCRAAFSVDRYGAAMGDLVKADETIEGLQKATSILGNQVERLEKRINDMGEHFDRDVQDVLRGIFAETIHERDTLKLENEELKKKLYDASKGAK